mmetsp:Transcript_4184/g.12996  ORF Transcript_4184/g.12996 Transcript_4184/m.12996 type:complete len:212 (+) Transcript_4184:2099-2734(+)
MRCRSASASTSSCLFRFVFASVVVVVVVGPLSSRCCCCCCLAVASSSSVRHQRPRWATRSCHSRWLASVSGMEPLLARLTAARSERHRSFSVADRPPFDDDFVGRRPASTTTLRKCRSRGDVASSAAARSASCARRCGQLFLRDSRATVTTVAARSHLCEEEDTSVSQSEAATTPSTSPTSQRHARKYAAHCWRPSSSSAAQSESSTWQPT